MQGLRLGIVVRAQREALGRQKPSRLFLAQNMPNDSLEAGTKAQLSPATRFGQRICRRPGGCQWHQPSGNRLGELKSRWVFRGHFQQVSMTHTVYNQTGYKDTSRSLVYSVNDQRQGTQIAKHHLMPVRGRVYQYHFYEPKPLEWVLGKGKVPKLSVVMKNVKNYLDKSAEFPWKLWIKIRQSDHQAHPCQALYAEETSNGGHRHPNIPRSTQYWQKSRQWRGQNVHGVMNE